MAIPVVVLTLMPLKLLRTEQSELINRFSGERSIVHNCENISNNMFTEISKRGYTYVFTSPEIAISKRFKKYILDQSSFTVCLCLLVVDEIYLVEEWGRNFCLMYAEIDKVQKRIPCKVPLLGVSAILTKSVRSQAIEKAGFLPNYRLLQTFFDR